MSVGKQTIGQILWLFFLIQNLIFQRHVINCCNQHPRPLSWHSTFIYYSLTLLMWTSVGKQIAGQIFQPFKVKQQKNKQNKNKILNKTKEKTKQNKTLQKLNFHYLTWIKHKIAFEWVDSSLTLVQYFLFFKLLFFLFHFFLMASLHLRKSFQFTLSL